MSYETVMRLADALLAACCPSRLSYFCTPSCSEPSAGSVGLYVAAAPTEASPRAGAVPGMMTDKSEDGGPDAASMGAAAAHTPPTSLEDGAPEPSGPPVGAPGSAGNIGGTEL